MFAAFMHPTIIQGLDDSPNVNDLRSPRSVSGRMISDLSSVCRNMLDHEAAGQQVSTTFKGQRKTEQEKWFVAARIPLQFVENRQAAQDSDSITAVVSPRTDLSTQPPSFLDRVQKTLTEAANKLSTAHKSDKNTVTALLSITPPEPDTMNRRNFNQWLAGENQHVLITYGPGTPDFARRGPLTKIAIPTTLKDLIEAGPSSPISPMSLDDDPETPVSPLSLNDDPATPISPLSLNDDPQTPISPLSLNDNLDDDPISPLSLDDDEKRFMDGKTSFIFPDLQVNSRPVSELKRIRTQISAKEDDILKISIELHAQAPHSIRAVILKFRLSLLHAKIRKLRDRENNHIAELLNSADMQAEDAKSKMIDDSMSVDSGYQGSGDTVTFGEDKLDVQVQTPEGSGLKSERVPGGKKISVMELRRKSSVLLRGGSIRQKLQCRVKGRAVLGEEEFAMLGGF